jgi:hypothetical protein
MNGIHNKTKESVLRGAKREYELGKLAVFVSFYHLQIKHIVINNGSMNIPSITLSDGVHGLLAA